MFAIGTAAPTTLEFNLAGGVISAAAITINNVNQTLEVGPLGTLSIGATQNVTNGTILMAGGTLTDASGVSLGNGTSNGSLSGFGTVAANLTRSGSGTADTITAIGGNLTLSSAIGSNSGLVFAIGSTDVSALQLSADPGDGNTFTFLGSHGELALTGTAASGFDDSILGLDVAGTLTPTNLVHILGETVTVASGQIGLGTTGTVTLSDGAVMHLSGITNASGLWFVNTAPDSSGTGTEVFLSTGLLRGGHTYFDRHRRTGHREPVTRGHRSDAVGWTTERTARHLGRPSAYRSDQASTTGNRGAGARPARRHRRQNAAHRSAAVAGSCDLRGR